MLSWMLIENNAAGDVDVIPFEDGDRIPPGYICLEEFDTEEEAYKGLDKYLDQTQVWVVFVNNAAGKAFYSCEDAGSGNWNGTKYPGFIAMKEFETEKEAREEVEKWNEHFNTIREEKTS